MKLYEQLYHPEVLKYIYSLPITVQTIRLTTLDQKNQPIFALDTIATGGSISVNGKSAMRRTGSITCVVEDTIDITDVKSNISMNKKVRVELGIENTGFDYADTDIFWFPLGVYIIQNASITKNTSGIQISLSLQDKMALLNGSAGGTLTGAMVHSPYQEYQDGEYVSVPAHVKAILYSLLTEFASLNRNEIIIADIDNEIRNEVYYNGYEYAYFIPRKSDSQTTAASDESQYSEQTLNFDATPPTEGIYYTNGETFGATMTSFTYPGKLESNAGEAITNVLDKIKNTLGDYEYFFDVFGNFRWQKTRTLLNEGSDSSLSLGEAIDAKDFLATTTSRSVWSFEKDSDLIAAYSNKPDYNKIKNDIVVWGEQNGTKRPIRYHLLIQDTPTLSGAEVAEFAGKYFSNYTDSLGRVHLKFIGSDDTTENKITFTEKQIEALDWRHKIYLYGLTKPEYQRSSLEKELIMELPKVYNVTTTNANGWLFNNKWSNMEYCIDILSPTSPSSQGDNTVSSRLQNFSVESIGRREKAFIDKGASVVLPSGHQNIMIIPYADGEEDTLRTYWRQQNVNFALISQEEYNKNVGLGIRNRSCYDSLRSSLHEYINYGSTITLTTTPIYHLEPNTRVSVADEDTGIKGDFLINSYSIPLTLTGTMNFNATQTLERI